VPFAIGTIYGVQTDVDKCKLEIWIIFLIPIVLAFVQVILMICAFPFDTPVMLKQKQEYEKLRRFMSKIYNSYVV